jgi:DNA-binding NarL/FixJ family response regulator
MANQIRIAVIDDHPLYREGIVQTLTEAEGLEVVAEGAMAAHALKVAQECLPDVILLDLRIPGGGVEAAANIADACPHVRIIMLTASENAQDVTSALQAGARGYILKGSSGPEGSRRCGPFIVVSTMCQRASERDCWSACNWRPYIERLRAAVCTPGLASLFAHRLRFRLCLQRRSEAF